MRKLHGKGTVSCSVWSWRRRESPPMASWSWWNRGNLPTLICAVFKSVTCSNYFRYLDFSDFSSSVWKPLKNNFFSAIEVLERGDAWEFVPFPQSAGTQGLPGPSTLTGVGWLLLAHPVLSVWSHLFRQLWNASGVLALQGTQILSSCSQCSTDAMNLTFNPSVFTMVCNLTWGRRIHGSCTFSYPKGAAGEHSVV